MKRRGRKSDAQLRFDAKVEAVRAQHRALMERATELAMSQAVPTEAELLAALQAAGLPNHDADRLKADLDKRNRATARKQLAAARRDQVWQLSLEGVSVGEIAERLGLAYDYVVQLRAKLDVPRARKRR
ncbi:hypothetical protein [Novosphingobium colocasiae]|uniref:hypothetical protein n=1 Tax=Novosphingobium colocasiae TaxID=1256513 RepID=UPI0035B16296